MQDPDGARSAAGPGRRAGRRAGRAQGDRDEARMGFLARRRRPAGDPRVVQQGLVIVRSDPGDLDAASREPAKPGPLPLGEPPDPAPQVVDHLLLGLASGQVRGHLAILESQHVPCAARVTPAAEQSFDLGDHALARAASSRASIRAGALFRGNVDDEDRVLDLHRGWRAVLAPVARRAKFRDLERAHHALLAAAVGSPRRAARSDAAELVDQFLVGTAASGAGAAPRPRERWGSGSPRRTASMYSPVPPTISSGTPSANARLPFLLLQKAVAVPLVVE